MNFFIAEEKNIDDIVEFHKKNFDTYFLTNLGSGILKKYYLQFIKDSECDFVICINDVGIVQGIALFINDYDNQIKKFLKKNFFALGFTVAYKFIINSKIRNDFTKKIANLFRSSGNSELRKKNYDYKNTLLSLATDNSCRGQGVAPKMLALGEEKLLDRNVKGYYLSVLNNNDGAIGFYKKNNFVYSHSDGQLEYFYKDLGVRYEQNN